MTIYIIAFLVVLLIPVIIGIVHFAKHTSEKRAREHVRGRKPRNGTPVTLDRNPEMPKMPGATS